MTPTTYTNVGPFRLRAEKDADILAALEAVGKGNQAALFRAAVRLALNAPLDTVVAKGMDAEGAGGVVTILDFIGEDDRAVIKRAREEKAIVERAREGK